MSMMLPPPMDSVMPFVLQDQDELEDPPVGYRWTRCPSCEEWHLRKSSVRIEPLRDYPRTDTQPAPR